MSFVDAHDFPVDLVLRVLSIPASTYYDWRTRQAAPGRRQLEDAELLEMIVKIRASHEFAGTYGSPRVWLALRRQGVRCGRKRVERIMRANGLQGAFRRKGWKGDSTKQNPRHTAAPDLVDRDFTATAPNRLWVADLTRILTGEGVLWLASVRDAFSNKVVGWATTLPTPRTRRTTSATPAAPPLPAELEALLRRMRLPYLRAAAPDVLATARSQRWDPAEMLRVLINEEVIGRDAATRRMRRKTANFPSGKTFATWRPDESTIPAPTQQALSTLEWVSRAENLAVAGPSGRGYHCTFPSSGCVKQSQPGRV
jgi:hypothetical protein